MSSPILNPATGPGVQANPGTLPPARPGNVAYFANLSCMFFDNEELTRELRRCVKTLSTYGGRLLPIISLLWSGEENLLLVERLPLQLCHDYFGQELDLRLPRLLTYEPRAPFSAELESTIRATPDAFLDGFVTDQHLVSAAERTGSRLAGSLAGSRLGNDKVLLNRFLKEAGELVFDGLEVSSPAEVAPAVAELASRGYHSAAAKSAIGASGIGLIRFPTADPPPIPDCHFHEGPCLIEGWLDNTVDRISHIASPSVQMVVTEDTVHLYDITDQILGEDSVHEGNVAPPVSFNDRSLEEELLRQAGLTGRWLHHQGYRGTASTDFHLAFLNSGETELRVCEINARVTGATYPSLLARHFQPEGAWSMRNLRLPTPEDGSRILESLDQASLLYRRGAACGVLPVNLNLEEDGLVSKGQFLFMGRNPAEIQDLTNHTRSLENLLFDRD
ncbi:MAG: hypothetical protein VCA35_10660 [Roseibacillus sp.]